MKEFDDEINALLVFVRALDVGARLIPNGSYRLVYFPRS